MSKSSSSYAFSLANRLRQAAHDESSKGQTSNPSTTPSADPTAPQVKVKFDGFQDPGFFDDSSSSDDELILKPRKQPKASLDASSSSPPSGSQSRKNTSDPLSARVERVSFKPPPSVKGVIMPSYAGKKRPLSASYPDAKLAPKRRRLEGGQAYLDVVNEVDNASLPSNFRFVSDYVFRQGTSRMPREFSSGCNCGQNNGQFIGCEYVKKCQCMEDARDEDGNFFGFPYHGTGHHKGCLQAKYLKSRNMIYECSELCRCGLHCRNRVVQFGRKVPLEIFRTTNRGWGLRSPVFIRKGQFIDTYRGEVITDAEADRREKTSEKRTKDSYLFSLDKFQESQGFDDSELFVVDGEFKGGPTRFVNHSCDPTCAIFAVSTVRGDAKVYELALFALEDIPPRGEFTFDYANDDDDKATYSDAGAKLKEQRIGKLATRCLCGSKNCRGYVWL